MPAKNYPRLFIHTRMSWQATRNAGAFGLRVVGGTESEGVVVGLWVGCYLVRKVRRALLTSWAWVHRRPWGAPSMT
ncbi:hypothetical protein ACFYWY_34275, partial [Streptomyces sp. NPDC002870]|uniref:hypothetical protein n=1 Tax=Streptomyces sp. NPDC002870 TaxID=3364666 RepID=UPI003679211B